MRSHQIYLFLPVLREGEFSPAFIIRGHSLNEKGYADDIVLMIVFRFFKSVSPQGRHESHYNSRC